MEDNIKNAVLHVLENNIADYKQIALDVPVVGGYDDEHC